jgi:16S rRNA (cytosine967-C5)-methyltransferase
VDAPCSGLGTLHRHADARWTQTPQSVQELVELQRQILNAAATWVKPGGVLVYATCTLHPAENEDQIEAFLGEHPQWRIELPPIAQRVDHPQSPWSLDHPQCLKLWPHRSQMDGFFMVRLKNGG